MSFPYKMDSLTGPILIRSPLFPLMTLYSFPSLYLTQIDCIYQILAFLVPTPGALTSPWKLKKQEEWFFQQEAYTVTTITI